MGSGGQERSGDPKEIGRAGLGPEGIDDGVSEHLFWPGWWTSVPPPGLTERPE